MVRCIFFDTEISARKCLETQLSDKAICKTCEDGKIIKEMLQKMKESGNKEGVMPEATLRQAQGDICHGELVEPCHLIKKSGNKEGIMPEKKKYPKAKCEVEGCNKFAWRDRCCMVHYKEKHGIPRKVNKSQVSQGAPPIKKAKAFNGDDIGPRRGRGSEPENNNSSQPPLNLRGGEGALRGEQRGVIDNNKTTALLQLLYISDILDGQLNNAIENGIIDTKTILDIRFRLGAILRGNVGIPPAEMRT